MHGISEKVWMNYFDENIATDEKLRIDSHLSACPNCRDFYEKMVKTEISLKLAGVEIRNSFQVDEHSISINLAKVLARILDTEAKQQSLSRNAIKIRLEQLEDILAVMCGSWTAVNALRVAAEKTIADSPENLSDENWLPFLEKLKNITSVFCGESGAKLIWQYGQL